MFSYNTTIYRSKAEAQRAAKKFKRKFGVSVKIIQYVDIFGEHYWAIAKPNIQR